MGLNYPIDSFSIKIYNKKISAHKTGANLNVNFLSKKIDANHWYALCTDSTNINSHLNKVDLNMLLNHFNNL